MPIRHHGGDLFNFEPYLQILDTRPSWPVADQAYADEPMLFSADWSFARERGGPMTQLAMNALEDHTSLGREALEATDLNIVIDTRVHMLMPGMLPAIGGWHCDAVPRPGGEYGDQPDPRLYDSRVVHYTMTMAQGETSRTEFMNSSTIVQLPPGERVWTKLHQAIQTRDRHTTLAPHGMIARFDQGTPRRATPSSTPGWRFFFRASLYGSVPRNQIRRQVQVYIPHEGHGW